MFTLNNVRNSRVSLSVYGHFSLKFLCTLEGMSTSFQYFRFDNFQFSLSKRTTIYDYLGLLNSEKSKLSFCKRKAAEKIIF
jgi:hypothetical protein